MNRTLAMLGSLLVLCLGLVAPANAACPIPGTYSTTLGNVDPGRVSESWCTGAAGQPGNMQNAMSWDGAALGAQWHVWGMTIDAMGAVEIGNTVDGSGNGTITYQTGYDGGQFWLSGANVWSPGGDLVGLVQDYVVVATVTVIGGTPVGLTSNVSFHGTFDACGNDCIIEFAIANAIRIGQGDMLPADYPACCINVSIDCAVDADSATWGSIKGLYR
jgi:hypothetical protein